MFVDPIGITQEDIDEKRRVPEREMMSAMETLIKSGGDLNQLGEQGAAPLHIAAACGYLDVACFLLQHGASLDLQDRDGWAAIHIAACWGQVSLADRIYSSCICFASHSGFGSCHCVVPIKCEFCLARGP
ncbi:unnamed protein product [Dibothriocephalus latus]|uniref:Uncharacterized protein n=1 Tax=Dibothriocephalus latus TaxID=60516 RepID=A0A3P7LX58_DIBLA|nr:unnamed protein product [Dibothriocephalus latus]